MPCATHCPPLAPTKKMSTQSKLILHPHASNTRRQSSKMHSAESRLTKRELIKMENHNDTCVIASHKCGT